MFYMKSNSIQLIYLYGAFTMGIASSCFTEGHQHKNTSNCEKNIQL